MQAVLITIGDEILSGNTVDTNSHFIAGQLKDIGIKVLQIFTISDEVETIINTLKIGFQMADLIITTGGLGPTRDDKTKKAFAQYFDDEITLDDATFQHLKTLMEKRNRAHLLHINRGQAEVLSRATILQNENGTAPCQVVEDNGKIAICLPGVPYEVKPLIKDKILPWLKDKFSLNFIKVRIVSVVGIPESLLALKIENWELALPNNISLSYLPIGSRIKLKLTATGNDETLVNQQLEEQIQKLFPLIGQHIIATSGDQIEDILHDLLIEKNLKISCAESCTGGQVARLLAAIPGSSTYFLGGIVAYETAKKIEILKVRPETVEKHTVVSHEVAEEMAKGCREIFKTNIALSTTGVAGPGFGEDGKAVGTVFYTIIFGDKAETHKLFLPHLERDDFMNFVAQKVLETLVVMLLETSNNH